MANGDGVSSPVRAKQGRDQPGRMRVPGPKQVSEQATVSRSRIPMRARVVAYVPQLATVDLTLRRHATNGRRSDERLAARKPALSVQRKRRRERRSCARRRRAALTGAAGRSAMRCPPDRKRDSRGAVSDCHAGPAQVRCLRSSGHLNPQTAIGRPWTNTQAGRGRAVRTPQALMAAAALLRRLVSEASFRTAPHRSPSGCQLQRLGRVINCRVRSSSASKA